MAELEKQTEAVNLLSIEVDRERQRIMTTAPAEQLNLSDYDAWMRKTQEVITGTSEVKKQYHDEIKKRVSDIVVSKDGLVTIVYVDDSKDYFYFPENSRKTQGERYAVKLIVGEQYEGLENVSFTEEQMEQQDYIRNIREYDPSLLALYSPEKPLISREERFASDIKSYLEAEGLMLYKRSVGAKIGISDSRWQKAHKADLSEYGIQNREVTFQKAGKNYKATARILFLKEPSDSNIEEVVGGVLV